MRVLVSAYPFLNPITVRNGIQFVYHPWNRKPRPEEIVEEVVGGGYDGLIAGTERIENAIADQAKNLKVVSRVGSGLDNVDVEYFAARGVVTTYTPFGPVDAVAELVVGLMVAGLRRFRLHDARVRCGEWKRDFGGCIAGRRVGIVGFGRIGKRVAALLAPFRCKVLLHDIAPDVATAHAMGLDFVPKEALLRDVDILTLHVPLKPDTRDWLGHAELALCKEDVLIVNASRGGIVSDAAMVEFLRMRGKAYYCADVYSKEPYAGDLVGLENTVLLPHVGASTRESRLAMEVEALENCISVLSGKPCVNTVTENL